jgi:hypothetical protein
VDKQHETAAELHSLRGARYRVLSPADGRFKLSQELLLVTSTLRESAAAPLLLASITSAVSSGIRCGRRVAAGVTR